MDVLDGRAVRLLQGDYDRVEVDAGDPLELVRQAAATSPPLVHVVALDAARDGGAPVELARAVVAAAAPVPVQLGGGVRSVADAVALAEAGVARVIVGTAAFGEIPLRDFVAALGEQLVVAVDVADGIVRTAGWLESSELTTRGGARALHRGGRARASCARRSTATARAAAPTSTCCARSARSFGGSILAAGGIRDAADVDAVRGLGIDGVVVGRAWLDGTLAL